MEAYLGYFLYIFSLLTMGGIATSLWNVRGHDCLIDYCGDHRADLYSIAL